MIGRYRETSSILLRAAEIQVIIQDLIYARKVREVQQNTYGHS